MELQLRPATLADASGIARVHWLGWQATYPGILPSTEIERHTLANRVTNWHRMLLTPSSTAVVWVALSGAEVIGFASGGAFRVEKASPGAAAEPSAQLTVVNDGDGDGDGELNALYLLTAWHGQGIGRRLFAACARDLHAAGFHALRCWVLHGNPAVGFYERLGGVRQGTKTYAAVGAPVLERGYRFTLPCAGWPAEVVEVAAALDCPAPQPTLGPPLTSYCL